MSISFLWLSAVCCFAVSSMALHTAAGDSLRCVMYLTGQHPEPPPVGELAHVTHVALAFMESGYFNDDDRSQWPLFTNVGTVRRQFFPGTKVMIAIGGWGDTEGFSSAAVSEESRRRFARNVAKMVEATSADGVDIDWEYPGGNGEDYKKVPNSKKTWETDAYPLLLAELRSALGAQALISAAVPGLERDMMAFTQETIPRIMRHLDFLNIMTYDLVNRRDNVTKHHTGVENSRQGIQAYISRGAAPAQLNLGLAFYIKFLRTEHDDCVNAEVPVGCKTLLLEDPETGVDLGRTGGFSWHDRVPDEVAGSFARAQQFGSYDTKQGGWYFWDDKEDIWWTYDTEYAIIRKFPLLVQKMQLGGVFAWGLGEDGNLFRHLQAVRHGLTVINATLAKQGRDEL
ncbi:Chitinase 1 [Pleurostoma richardsiae]|uniref:chitinase n=1 Tax=Pleurostoma richardsiae TaxID=41990 RepID=A0AA38RTE8_9PEZI|nr:Chitinase 1 [Pleurostoma richardsiae]